MTNQASNPSLPSISISQTQLTEKPRTRQISFGDGYTLDSPERINGIRREYQIYWRGISDAEKNTLINFFRKRRGHERISWEPPNDGAGMWVCQQWRSTPVSGVVLWDVHATLVERF